MVKTKKSNYSVISPEGKVDAKVGSKTSFASCAIRKRLAGNEKRLKDSLEMIESLVNVQSNKALLVSSQICSICAFNFNNIERLPICLPCGHTVCKVCVYSLKHSLLTGICPYDRKEYFFIQELLPINFSLLYTENIEEIRACAVHGYEIVAYCIDHENLLCGKCLISHLTHNFIDIESDQAKEIALKKSVLFDEISKKIEDFFETWKKFYYELQKIILKRKKSSKPSALTKILLSKSLSQEPVILSKIQTLKESFLSSSSLSQFKSSFPVLNLASPDDSILEDLLK